MSINKSARYDAFVAGIGSLAGSFIPQRKFVPNNSYIRSWRKVGQYFSHAVDKVRNEQEAFTSKKRKPRKNPST